MARRRRPCPCALPAAYDECCGRWHRETVGAAGGPAAGPPTAELLMRSRYTAFAVGDAAYLLLTWHPSTRPARLVLDDTRWTGLEVVGATGGLFDVAGTVRFRASWEGPGGAGGVLEEHSRFVREAGRWLYVGPLAG